MRRSRAIARRDGRWRSPTAASISCTSATCGISGLGRGSDRLIVAVNDDPSVVGLKGDGRPILTAADRAELVAALRCVHYVVVFGDATVERLLLLVKPDVHCKGTDYTVESVPERAVVAGYGGRTAIVGDAKSHATRELLARIARTNDQGPTTKDQAR